VIVAVVAMGVMKAPLAVCIDDQVIRVIAMRDRLVAAARAAHVVGRMLAAFGQWPATIGVLLTDRNGVLGHLAGVGLVMQMTVMHIVHVPLVPDGGVSTAFAMGVRMRVMVLMICHD
jgi:hypothetical protein